MPLSTMHRQESKIPGCLRASSALSQSRVETFEATMLETPPCPVLRMPFERKTMLSQKDIKPMYIFRAIHLQIF